MDCFKWKSVLWSDESKFGILVGNHGRRVLRAKEEGDLPACYQHSVQKPASLMVWGCISAYGMDSLHVLEGTMNAERYIKNQNQNQNQKELYCQVCLHTQGICIGVRSFQYRNNTVQTDNSETETTYN